MTKIRLMLDEDIPQVAVIEKMNFSRPWSENNFHESIGLDNTLYIVAERKGKIIGYCGTYMVLKQGNITNFVIAEKSRKRGIGRKMIFELFSMLKEKGIVDVTLEVRESNIPAIKLYKSAGFKKVGIRKNFYTRPQENAVIMWKRGI